MLRNRINNFALSLLVIAFAGFLFVSTGGEFLHKQIHHHADQTSHDQCALYLLAAQLFTAVLAVALAVVRQDGLSGRHSYRTTFTHSFVNLACLRAPPVSR